jgi:TonB family protein
MLLGIAGPRSYLYAATLCIVAPQLLISQERKNAGVMVQRVVSVSYPPLANLGRIEGAVELAVVVSHAGAVQGVRVISGQPLLVESARKALVGWRFRCPTSSQPCEARVSFRFELLDDVCDKSCCPSEVQIDLPNQVTVKAKRSPPSID